MDYIQEALNVLRYYSDLRASLPILDWQIEKLQNTRYPDAEKGLNRQFQLAQLATSRRDTANELAEVEQILDDISKEPGTELYGPILRKKFIEKQPRAQIIKDLSCKSTQYQNIGEKAIVKFAIRYHGIAALSVISGAETNGD